MKLRCTAHDMRVMVLLDNEGEPVTVHRSTGFECDTTDVVIGSNVLPAQQVPRLARYSTLSNPNHPYNSQ